VQIIDKDEVFLSIQKFTEVMKQWKMLEKGFGYYVVAILGAQSSGKSTLLNLLFGTSFEVMIAQDGRTQTTQGVWMGNAHFTSPEKEKGILVFDVEGVDSRERGEQHASFERKSSLFSLALSDVLIINMWHTDVGRYKAGNVDLLRTVFELNLHLFAKSSGQKTKILFVIRDHIPKETPLEKLQTIVMKDMRGIWESLIKPEAFANAKLEEFFDFSFAALSHKVLMEEDFMKGIQSLRERFMNCESDYFLLGKSYSKDVPSDGFPVYAQSIWETVKYNKDLNIPSQKEMLAIYRCDEISAEAFKNFQQNISILRKTLDNNDLVEDFGMIGSRSMRQALGLYDGPASRYSAEIASQKREILVSNMTEVLHTLFMRQMHVLLEKSTDFFEKLLAGLLPANGSYVKNFSKEIILSERSTLSFFEHRARESLVDNCPWTYTKEMDELKDILDKRIKEEREKQLNLLMNEIENGFNASVSKPLDRILEQAKPEMWEDIRQLFGSAKRKSMERLREQLQEGFECKETEVESQENHFEEISFMVLKRKMIEKSKYLNFILSKRFEELFNLDERGLPRRWTPTDDIGSIFLEAKRKTELLLEAFCLLRLSPELDSVVYMTIENENTEEKPNSVANEDLKENNELDPKYAVLSPEEAQSIRERFRRDAQTMYLQAIRDQESVKQTAYIPMYIIMLLLVVGFDELLYLLSHPLLLIVVLLLGGMFYLLNLLNLTSPMKTLFNTGFHLTWRAATELVSEQLNRQSRKNAVKEPQVIHDKKKKE